MIGNKPKNIILQPRDLAFMKELAVLEIIDREQGKLAGGFRSTTRVNARLLGLLRLGVLKRFYVAAGIGAKKSIYCLSAAGARLVNAPHRRIRRASGQLAVGLFVEHQLQINEVYFTLKHRPVPDGISLMVWRVFHEKLSSTVPLIPDAYFELATPAGVKPMFLEVDLGTETSAVWSKKAANYVALATSGLFTQRFGKPKFRVLVITHSTNRLETIRRTVANTTDKVFWFTTFSIINREGFWSPIWLRPTGEERLVLV